MEHLSLSRETQKLIAAILRKDEWFDVHRVRIIEQNSEDLATVLREKVENIDGPVVVIGTDAERNDYPAVECDVSINVTEVVSLNRSIQGFATAIEVAEAIIDDLDGEDWHWNDDLRHETPREMSHILIARTTFRGCVERPSIPNNGEELTEADHIERDNLTPNNEREAIDG